MTEALNFRQLEQSMSEIAESHDLDTGADASPETEVEVEAELDDLESEAESPPAEAPTEPDPIKERIDKLTSRFRDTERDLQTISQERDDLRQRLDSLETPPQEDKPKTLADFDYDEAKYQQWAWSQAEKRAEAAAERKFGELSDQLQAQQSAQQRVESFQKREREFAKSVDDYHDVTSDRYLPITKEMAAEIQGSDVGPEMAYYLGKHPDEAAEISRLPEPAVVRRMVQLESRIQAEKSSTGNKVSGAPPPPSKTVKGAEAGRKVSTTDPKSDKMSDKEWFKREALRQAKRRGG